ncbi:MAG: phosphatidylglycerol:prolipoprotein diacylglycerol transferase [Candidatus Peregrinibacteria bacterium Greene1014_49]|nr:MAG: phosphatidylglycerol:prolipoprotein diacylglycerol transferase [Candidatus Peregrinibacteria bacterium Greene1014_49]
MEFFLRLAVSAHLSIQHFREHALQYLFAFLAAGRLFAMLADYRLYMKDPIRIFILWDGGWSYLGGAIGIGMLLWWISRTHRATFLQWLDVLVPAATFGLAFDWLGKFAAGNAYGHPADVPWAITYDAINVRYTVPIHPVQLYYAFVYLMLTFLLLIIRKRSQRAGAETLCGIILASFITFFFEYFRGDFTIPVFATKLDFLILLMLFLSLGVFAIVETKLAPRVIVLYQSILVGVFAIFIVARQFLNLPTHELRFSQFLAVLALLATIVYVTVHRRKYPHL